MTARTEHIRQATVLGVDDGPHVLSDFKRVPHTCDCRVLQAYDGSCAPDILEREQIEVLICDEAMPGMCGTEVPRQPRRDRRTPLAYCSPPIAMTKASTFRQ